MISTIPRVLISTLSIKRKALLGFIQHYHTHKKVNIYPEYHKDKIIITCSSFANKRLIFASINTR